MLLAEGIHRSHDFLQVAAGPDVAEGRHAAMLRFIRTGRNAKMTPFGCAEQTGVFAAESECWDGSRQGAQASG